MKISNLSFAALAAAGVGVLSAFILIGKYSSSPDLGMFLVMLIALVANLSLLVRMGRWRWRSMSVALTVAYIVSALGFVVNTANSATNYLYCWFLLLTLNINLLRPGTLEGLVQRFFYLGVIVYPFHLLVGPLANAVDIFKEFFGVRKLLGGENLQRAKKGLQTFLLFALIGIPTILVVMNLLSAASDSFSSIFGSFFDFELDLLIFALRGVAAVALGWVMFGQLLFALYINKKPQGEEPALKLSEDTRESLGIALGLTVLVLNLFYIVFVIAQLRYDLGNLSALIAERQITSFSELAVGRFWELILVSMINIGLVFLGGSSLRSSLRLSWLRLVAQINVAFLLVNTVLLILSTWQRLSLYIGGYGFSHKRFDALIFLPILLLVAVLVMGSFFTNTYRDKLQKAATILLVCFWAIMFSLPATFVINKLNLDLYRQGSIQVFDPMYTLEISEQNSSWAQNKALVEDGVIPAGYKNDVSDFDGMWVAAELVRDTEGKFTSPVQRRFLEKRLREYTWPKYERKNWREFNLANYLLREQLKKQFAD